MTFCIWSTSACGHLSVGFRLTGALFDSRVWADATALLPSTAAHSTAIATTRMRIQRVSHPKSHSQRRQPARVAAGALGPEAAGQVGRPEGGFGGGHEGRHPVGVGSVGFEPHAPPLLT